MFWLSPWCKLSLQVDVFCKNIDILFRRRGFALSFGILFGSCGQWLFDPIRLATAASFILYQTLNLSFFFFYFPIENNLLFAQFSSSSQSSTICCRTRTHWTCRTTKAEPAALKEAVCIRQSWWRNCFRSDWARSSWAHPDTAIWCRIWDSEPPPIFLFLSWTLAEHCRRAVASECCCSAAVDSAWWTATWFVLFWICTSGACHRIVALFNLVSKLFKFEIPTMETANYL